MALSSNKQSVQAFIERYTREQGLTMKEVGDNSISFHAASSFGEANPVITPLPQNLNWITHGCDYAVYPYFNQRREPILVSPDYVGVKVQALHLRLDLPPDSKLAKAPQLPGVDPLLYLPEWDQDIAELWANIALPFIITEGQSKAIVATREFDIYTIGAPGVNNAWSTSLQQFRYPLNEMQLKGRKKAYICYDQDTQSTWAEPLKKDVSHAAMVLAAALMRFGVEQVYFLFIRRTKLGEKFSGRKLGVNDYFNKGGNREELLATAVLAEESTIVLKLLKSYGVMVNGKIYDGEHNQDIDMAGLRTLYANQPTLDGTNPADVWRTHEGRIQLVQNPFIIDPDSPLGLSQDGYCNLWKPFDTPIVAEPNLRDIVTFRKFVYGLVCGGRKTSSSWIGDWILGWLAHIVQRPREKSIHIVFVLSSNEYEGSGKTLLGVLMTALLGRTHARVISGTEFMDPNNKFRIEHEGLEFFGLDELETRYHTAPNVLKIFATAEEVSVNQKNEKKRYVDNALRIYLPSNAVSPIPMSNGGRREFVARFTPPGGNFWPWQDFVKELAARIKARDMVLLSSIMTYLSKLDYKALGYDPFANAPDTPAKLAMIGASRSKRQQTAVDTVKKLPMTLAWCPKLNVSLAEGNDQYYEADVLKHTASQGTKQVSLNKEFVQDICKLTNTSFSAVMQVNGKSVDNRTFAIQVASRSEVLPTVVTGTGVNRRYVVDMSGEEIKACLLATAKALYEEQELQADPD